MTAPAPIDQHLAFIAAGIAFVDGAPVGTTLAAMDRFARGDPPPALEAIGLGVDHLAASTSESRAKVCRTLIDALEREPGGSSLAASKLIACLDRADDSWADCLAAIDPAILSLAFLDALLAVLVEMSAAWGIGLAQAGEAFELRVMASA